MDIKKLFILIITLCFYNQSLIAETKSQLPLEISFEKCADQTFKSEYGRKYIDYLNKPLKIKLANSTPYEWFYEDCEAENLNHPITFKVKNSIYNNELDDLFYLIFLQSSLFSQYSSPPEPSTFSSKISTISSAIEYRRLFSLAIIFKYLMGSPL